MQRLALVQVPASTGVGRKIGASLGGAFYWTWNGGDEENSDVRAIVPIVCSGAKD